jgi:small subunit ribosomal protein S7
MRGKPAPKRNILPDELHGSYTVSKLINRVMLDGKKATARTLVYKALEELSEKTKENPADALEKALANIKPRIEIRSRRVGGSNLQVPTPVRPERQLTLALRWLVDAARNARKAEEFSKVLARELINAFNNEGTSVRKKEDVQRMAEANRAFAQTDISAPAA